MIIEYTSNNYFQSIQLGQMDLSSGPAFLGSVMLYLQPILDKDQVLFCGRYRTKLLWLQRKREFPPGFDSSLTGVDAKALKYQMRTLEHL